MSTSSDEKKEQAADSLLFSVGEIAGKGDCDKLVATIKEAGTKPIKKVIIDLKETREISTGFISAFVQLSHKLKAEKKEILTINAGADIKRQLMTNGVSALFNLAGAYAPAGATKEAKPQYKLDAELINPFIDGVTLTFKRLLRVDITPEKPKLKDRKNPRPCEIAGLINIQSEGFNFSIAVCFLSDVFLRIYEGMTKEKHEKITQEIEDGAAEILNIIYGHAKTTLTEKGYPLVMAIPTVITGEKIGMASSSPKPTIELAFSSPYGVFHLEVNIEGDRG